MDSPAGQAQHGEYASLILTVLIASFSAHEGVFGLWLPMES